MKIKFLLQIILLVAVVTQSCVSKKNIAELTIQTIIKSLDKTVKLKKAGRLPRGAFQVEGQGDNLEEHLQGRSNAAALQDALANVVSTTGNVNIAKVADR